MAGTEDLVEIFRNGFMYVYPTDFSGYGISHEKTSKKGKDTHVFDLTLVNSIEGGHESIKIHTWDMFLGVFVSHGVDDHSLFQGSLGMMGDFNTGEVIGRDGVSAADSPDAFAAEWQVHADGTDPVLFRNSRAPVYPEACFLPEQIARAGLNVSPATRRAAETACAKWGEAGMKDCVYDVIATGNLEIADAEVY